MKKVIDYGTRPGAGRECPGIQISNYESAEGLYLGEWKPLTEIKGYPDMGKENVLDVFCKKIISEEMPVDYICMGELTNLAALLFVHPEVISRISRIFICPGEVENKGTHPVSQANILCDPIAARVVLNSDIKKIIAMADTTEEQRRQIYDYLKKAEEKETCEAYVSVQLDYGCTYGSLYIDRWNICKKDPNAVLLENN